MRCRGVGTLLATLVLVALGSNARAGAFRGTVKSIEGSRLTLEFGSDGEIKVFRVPTTAKIARGGAPVPLGDIAAGTTVSVFTTVMGEVYKINISVPRRPRPNTVPGGPIRPRDPEPVRAAPAESWTTFRGPNRANRSAATGLLDEWPEGGPRVDTTYRGLGAGYSSVSIADGRLFTLGTKGPEEMLFALDADDTGELWAFRTGLSRRDGQGDGPRGTPTVDGESVYALGANGDLACVDVTSGRATWRKNILEDFGAGNITWGISESPLVDGNKVIVTPGGSGATMVALEKKSGRIIWRSLVPGTPQAAYSSAIVCQVGDVRQYVNFTSKGVVGIDAERGTPLWGDDSSSNTTANCSTPLFHADHVFSASGYGTGGAMVRLASGRGTTRSNVLYKAREMVNHHGGMVIVDGHVYGTNDNSLLCMDLRDGRVLWRDRSVGKGSITYAEGHLYVLGERGEIALVEASTEGYVEKGRFEHVNRSNRKLWSHPVVHEGRLYVRDQDTLTVYDIAKR